MIKKSKTFLAVALAMGIVMSQVGYMGSVHADENTTRYFGANRYATAIDVATKNWTSSDYAVIARGDDFPDALCAAPLAKAYNAPILLTEPTKLSDGVLATLQTLKVKTVFIIGGTGAVSATVENTLKTSFTVIRLSGADRYATSANVAGQVKTKVGSVPKVAVAYGQNFPDALSVSAPAAALGMPILLTDTNSLPKATSDFIKENGVTSSYVIGGTGVITDTVKGLLPNAKRLGGDNRFGTNVAVLDEFKDSINFSKVFVAIGDGTTGDEFADALSGSAAAALTGSPILLTYKTLSPEISDFIHLKMNLNPEVVALGGTAVVPDTVVTQVVNTVVTPTLQTITLINGSANVNAVIVEPTSNENIGSITFTLPAGITKYTTGTATLTQDLASAKISGVNINKTVTNVSKTSAFAQVIFDAMEQAGYTRTDGILASNIKFLLNGSVLTLTDKANNVKTYTIIIK